MTQDQSAESEARSLATKESRLAWSRSASPVAFGVVLSVGLAAILTVVTSATVLLGFCVGLLGTTLAMLYDLVRRIENRNDLEDQRSALMAAVDDHPWLLKELREIAVNAGAVLRGQHHSALFVDLLRAEIAKTRGFAQDINRGHLRVASGNPTPMSNQIDVVRTSVFATTIPEADNDWWLSAGGQDYLARNSQAIRERGVKVERVVLWSTIDENLAAMVRQQIDAGVDVYYVSRREIPAELGVSIAIYDEVVAHDVIFNHDGKDIFYEYSLDAGTVAEACDKFGRLKRLASSAPPPALVALLDQGLHVVVDAVRTTDAPAPEPSAGEVAN